MSEVQSYNKERAQELKRNWEESKDEAALRELVNMSSSGLEGKREVEEIFKELFGDFSRIAFGIARAGVVLVSKDQEMAEKFPGVEEYAILGFKDEPAVTLGLSSSNDELYQEKVKLLKEYESQVLKFLNNDKQLLYVFYVYTEDMSLPVRVSTNSMTIRRYMIKFEKEKEFKFSIFQTLVMITLEHAKYHYWMKNNTMDGFPHKVLIEKYGLLLKLYVELRDSCMCVFPTSESNYKDRYIGDDPEGEYRSFALSADERWTDQCFSSFFPYYRKIEGKGRRRGS